MNALSLLDAVDVLVIEFWNLNFICNLMLGIWEFLFLISRLIRIAINVFILF